jgi:hypothetical protein
MTDFQRLVIEQARGDLQLILARHFGSPVRFRVECHQVGQPVLTCFGDMTPVDRLIHGYIGDRLIYSAASTSWVEDPLRFSPIAQFINGEKNIGQIMSGFETRPAFSLLSSWTAPGDASSSTINVIMEQDSNGHLAAADHPMGAHLSRHPSSASLETLKAMYHPNGSAPLGAYRWYLLEHLDSPTIVSSIREYFPLSTFFEDKQQNAINV